MRVGRVEVRLWPRPRDWTIERWQWPHENFLAHYRAKPALVAVQIGPIELRLWVSGLRSRR